MSTVAKLMGHWASLQQERPAMKARARRYAARALPLLREVADPRGRCNRNAFLYIALTFLALQFAVTAVVCLVGIELGQTGTVLLNAPVLWIGTTVCVKRLHDIGRRGWWIPGAFGIWFISAFTIAIIVSMVLGAEAVLPGQPAFFAVFAAITLPAFGALLWLHTAPGVPNANRFGPVPHGLGLSMPPQKPRAARAFDMASVLA